MKWLGINGIRLLFNITQEYSRTVTDSELQALCLCSAMNDSCFVCLLAFLSVLIHFLCFLWAPFIYCQSPSPPCLLFFLSLPLSPSPLLSWLPLLAYPPSSPLLPWSPNLPLLTSAIKLSPTLKHNSLDNLPFSAVSFVSKVLNSHVEVCCICQDIALDVCMSILGRFGLCLMPASSQCTLYYVLCPSSATSMHFPSVYTPRVYFLVNQYQYSWHGQFAHTNIMLLERLTEWTFPESKYTRWGIYYIFLLQPANIYMVSDDDYSMVVERVGI